MLTEGKERNPEISAARNRRGRFLAVLPGVGAALLPRLACPSCWPAYAALLGVVGLEFIDYTPFLFPLTILFLILAIGSLRSRGGRRGYRPFTLGLFGSILLILGKFILPSGWAMYGGILLLMSASLWNAWLQRGSGESCSACVKPGGAEELRSK